ncbi:MAG: hypothetical protein J0L93_01995 [Deltaproteobacteria bacterium]|nr:hypothetical protein [Deltaproteobacteria bacterium]
MSKFLLLPVTVIAFNFMACGGSGGGNSALSVRDLPAAASGVLDDTIATEIKGQFAAHYTVQDEMAIFEHLPNNGKSFLDTASDCKIQITRGDRTDADHDGIPTDLAATALCSIPNAGIESNGSIDMQDANDADWTSGFTIKANSLFTLTGAKDDEFKSDSINSLVSVKKNAGLYQMDYRYASHQTAANGNLYAQPYAIFFQANINAIQKSTTDDKGKAFDTLRLEGSISDLKGFFQYETKAKSTLILTATATNLTYENGHYKTGQIILTDISGNQLIIDVSNSGAKVEFVKK